MSNFNIGDISLFIKELNGLELSNSSEFILDLSHKLKNENSLDVKMPSFDFYKKALEPFYKSFIEKYHENIEIYGDERFINLNSSYIAYKNNNFKNLNEEIKAFIDTKYKNDGPLCYLFTIVFHNLLFTSKGQDCLNRMFKGDSKSIISLLDYLINYTFNISSSYISYKNNKVTQLRKVKDQLHSMLELHALQFESIPGLFKFVEFDPSKYNKDKSIELPYSYGYFLATHNYYERVKELLSKESKNITEDQKRLLYKFECLDSKPSIKAFWARVLLESMNDLFDKNNPTYVTQILEIILDDPIDISYVRNIIQEDKNYIK